MTEQQIEEMIGELKNSTRRRFREVFENTPGIDDTTPICPICGYPNCEPCGYIINMFGKYHRRKCGFCGYAYVRDWIKNEIKP